MTPTQEQLKAFPCPFCGKEPSQYRLTDRLYCRQHTNDMALAEWNARAKSDGWIAASSGNLPDANTEVLTFGPDGVASAFITTSCYHTQSGKNVWMHWQSRSDGSEANVTHWQPLPEAPQPPLTEGGK